ncbi:MAG: hypothetical protein ACSLE1_09625 [Sphingobium sp.]
MEYAESRCRRDGQPSMRLLFKARFQDTFDWDLAYRKAVEALKPKNLRR